MNEECVICLSTFPDAETAQKIARELVKSGLVACANVLPALQSIYLWRGNVEESMEVLGIFKMTGTRFNEFQERLRKMHPYELPEIVGLKIDDGSPEYLRWIRESCAGK